MSTDNTSKLKVDIMQELIADKRLYIENLVKITDKNRNVKPFVFNNAQNDYWQTKSKRDIILKASQLGFTSLIGAEFLVDCLTIPGTISIIVSHEEFFTQRLLARVKFFESTIPKEFKPTIHHKSSYELTWPKINSSFYIGSARSYVFGRGEHITNFHASEIAFWDDPEKIMIPTLERCDYAVMESTPYGEGNYYHELCMDAMNKQNNWLLHFYAWWWDEGYRISIDDPLLERFQSDRLCPLQLTDEEAKLAENNNLDDDQIRWRRKKIRDLKDNFFQEYPEDPMTCFYSTASAAFDKKALLILQAGCREPIQTRGELRIWYPPKPSGFYIIGVDPTVGAGESNDRAAAVVWDISGDLPVHCASIHGHYDTNYLPVLIEDAGKYYNYAELSVEANNSGVAVLNRLFADMYPKIYYRQDLVTGESKNQLGWLTTKSSKPYMIHDFSRFVSLDPDNRVGLVTHDIELVRQLRNLRIEDMQFVSIGPDDLMMAAMIGLSSRTRAAIHRDEPDQYGWEQNWGEEQ